MAGHGGPYATQSGTGALHTDNAGMNLTVEFYLSPSITSLGAMQPRDLETRTWRR